MHNIDTNCRMREYTAGVDEKCQLSLDWQVVQRSNKYTLTTVSRTLCIITGKRCAVEPHHKTITE